jgi:nitrogen regulatory protein PII 2
MKEIMAIIRMNMVNPTKTALANAGYPAFFCRKCLGRGKKSVNMDLAQSLLESGPVIEGTLGEHLSEYQRLIAKRLFTLVVEDDQVDDAVGIIIDVNQTGNPGDGKIFILPVMESCNIRTGQLSGQIK